MIIHYRAFNIQNNKIKTKLERIMRSISFSEFEMNIISKDLERNENQNKI